MTKKAQHTPEPWNASGTIVRSGIISGEGVIIHQGGRVTDRALANARRIVAAVNACEGISTEALEQSVVKALVEALEKHLAWYRGDTSVNESILVTETIAAIAKARGGE